MFLPSVYLMTLSNKRIEDKSSESTLSIYPVATGTVKREGQSCYDTAWSIILLHEILFIS